MSRMRVVIIDDEVYVCELIKNIVEWEELGVELAAVASDGIAAFDLINTLKPEIAVVDIRMPGLDGLELIKKCEELQIPTRFILISGYKKFDYAQQALRYSVHDYIVKPISKEELNRSIKKIRDDILIKMEGYKNLEKLHSKLETQSGKLWEVFIESIIKGEWPPEGIDSINQKYDIHFKRGKYICLLAKIDMPEFNPHFLENIIIEHVQKIFHDELSAECFELGSHYSNNRITFILNYDGRKSTAIGLKIESAGNKVINYVDGYGCCCITIGSSNEYEESQQIKEAFSEAATCIEKRRLDGTRRVLRYSHLSSFSRPKDHYLSENEKAEIIALIEKQDIDGCKVFLSHFFSNWPADQESRSFYYLVLREIIDTFIDTLNTILSETNNDPLEKEKLYYLVDNEVESYSLQDSFEKALMSLFIECINNRQFWNNRHIRIAKRYIEENYSRPLQLEEVARVVNLNPVYFSVLFKEKTNSNFSTYLQNYRIEMAKELFRTTNESVKTVCEKVGYHDLRHFSHLFRKCVGVNPSIYKKIYGI